MSKFAVGNLLLFSSMICTTASHVMIKGLVDDVGSAGLGLGTIGELLHSTRILRSMSAGLLLVGGFLLWVLCLSRLSLSYAYPVASTSVLLIALFSVFTLGETITPKMWAGTALILVGIVLLRPAG
jgi:drug/metabolite transporter (DMT)-like permease